MHDDNRNIIMAIILSMAFLFVYYGYIAHMLVPPPAPQPVQSKTGSLQWETEAAPIKPISEALSEYPRIPIVNDDIAGTINLRGLLLDDVVLRNYFTDLDSKNAVRLLSPAHTGDADTFIRIGWLGENAPDAQSLWTPDAKNSYRLTWKNADGVVYAVNFNLDRNMLNVTQTVTNTSKNTLNVAPFSLLSRKGTLSDHGLAIVSTGAVGVMNGKLLQKTDSDLDDMPTGFQSEPATSGWLGLAQHYWFTGFIPSTKADFRLRRQKDPNGLRHQIDYVANVEPLLAGQTQSVSSHIYIGAKNASLLSYYQDKLNIPLFDRVMDYGTFYFITKPLFTALHFLYQQTGTMGAAILLLTLLVRLILFPLANKSYVAMNKMKELQPRIDELKERYKGTATQERLQFSQEVMKLYKDNKVNPASGCLPILIQLPIFLAMYKVLVISIDMRHAPFWGWVHDLSMPDNFYLFNGFGTLDITLPSFLHIGLWPIIMGVTMYISQLFNPKPTDKTQEVLFNLLPLMMVFFVSTSPAGLAIYWTWSNILSIGQQAYIKRGSKGVKVI